MTHLFLAGAGEKLMQEISCGGTKIPTGSLPTPPHHVGGLRARPAVAKPAGSPSPERGGGGGALLSRNWVILHEWLTNLCCQLCRGAFSYPLYREKQTNMDEATVWPTRRLCLRVNGARAWLGVFYWIERRRLLHKNEQREFIGLQTKHNSFLVAKKVWGFISCQQVNCSKIWIWRIDIRAIQ